MGGAFDARAFNGVGFFVGVLLTTSAITVSTVGTLTAPQPLTAQPGLAIATAATSLQAAALLSNITSRPYRDRVLADGAVAYWRLGETSGTLAHSEVGSYDGTISGGVTLNQPGALADGNRAMRFDGATGTISIPAAVLNCGPGTQSFSLECWINGAYLEGNSSLLKKGAAPFNGTGIGWELLHQGPGYWAFGRTNNGPVSRLEWMTTTPPPNAWSHIVVTYNGSTGTVVAYVNGVLARANALTGADVGTYTDSFPLLVAQGSYGWTAAAMDDIAIYPTALTAAQVAQHYALAAAPVVGSTITVGAAADLSTFTGMQAAAGIAIASSGRIQASRIDLNSGAGAFYGVAFYYPAFAYGQSYAGVNVASTVTLTAPIVFRATAAIVLSVDAAFLSMPAPLGAAAGITIGTAGNLVVVGVSGSSPVLVINGHPWTARVGSATIRDIVNEQTNTYECTIDAPAGAPVAGNDLRLGLGSLLPDRLIFGGVIQSVESTFTLTTDHPAWRVRAVDYGVLLNRRQVTCAYTNVSATTAALELVSKNSSGFTGNHIAVGLPPITYSQADGTLSAALTELANLIGGYWYVDYTKDVHLFISETDPATDPHPIDGTPPAPLADPMLSMSVDNTQRRTRILVVGMSVGLLAPVRAGAGEIPIETAQPFAGSGLAQFGSDGTRAPYASTTPGDVSAILVGNVATPGIAPTPALAPDVAGALLGTYTWAVAFGTASGETPIGPRTIALFCPDVAAPGASPGLGPTGQVGPLVGNYWWAVSYVTTLGETVIGQGVFRPCAALTPGAAGLQFGPAAISRLSAGGYTWAVTYLTAYGETLPGPSVSATLTDLPAPAAVTVGTAAGAGPLPIGVGVAYGVTLVSQDGETAIGATTGYTPPAFVGPAMSYQTALAHGGIYGGPYAYAIAIVTAAGESAITGSFNIGSGFLTAAPGTAPTWSGGQDTAGRIQPGYTYTYAASYFSDAYGETALGLAAVVTVGGASVIRLLMNVPALQGGADGIRIYRAQNNGPYTLNAELRRGNYPTQYWDVLSQGEQGASYPVNSLKAGVSVVLNVGASPEAGVVARRIYRTKSNGSEWYLVGEIQSNTPVTWTDVQFDAQLTTRNPVTGLAGRSAFVSGIQAGPTGTIARRIYRTKAGTGTLYLVGELKDNTSSTWVDTMPDSALTLVAPGRNTAGARYGGGQPLVSLPTGPPGVTGRRVYRTTVNGATFKLVVEIPNNTATSVLDDVPDAMLGAAGPPSTNPVGEAVSVSSIPTGPTGTLARRVYRTVNNGSDYRLVRQINNNSDTTFVDAVADRDLGAYAPLKSTAGSSAVLLSGIPIGPGDVTRRTIYRTAAGKTDLLYVGTISDNTTTTFLDARADTGLGKPPEATSTIGALAGQTSLVLSSVVGFPPSGWVDVDGELIHYAGISGTTLTGIPALVAVTITRAGAVATIVAPGGYPWQTGDTIVVVGAGQSEYGGAHVLTVLDGTRATFAVSGTPSSPATGRILAGLPTAAAQPVTIARANQVATITAPAHGWHTGDSVTVTGALQPEYNGAHVVTVIDAGTATYTVSGTPATPATGTILSAGFSGAITRNVDGGMTATTVPMLTGVSGVTMPHEAGDTVAVFVVCEDLAAQANLAAAEGGDGVHEAILRDSTLDSIAAAVARGQAELKLWAWPQVEVTYTTHDPLTRSGRTIQVALPALGMVATLKILEVTIDEIGVANRLYPRCTVRAASAKFSLTDLLRHAVLDV